MQVKETGDGTKERMENLLEKESFCEMYKELVKNEEIVALPKVKLHGQSIEKSPQSLMIYDLKRSIRSQYKNDKIDIVCHKTWMNDFIPEIIDFFKVNGESNLDPLIKINISEKEEKYNENEIEMNSHSCDNSDSNGNEYVLQSQLISLQRKKSGKCQIVSKYNKKNGFIPSGTIIGQFTGIEYFCDEIEDCQCNPLFFTQNGCIPSIMSLNDFMENDCQIGLNGLNGLNELNESIGICDLNKISDIIITSQNQQQLNLSLKFNCLLSQISDCRKTKHILNNKKPNKREQMKCNIVWLYCKINGWPMRFAMTRKDIYLNTVLYSYNDWNYSDYLDCRIKNLEKNDHLIDNIDKMLNHLCLNNINGIGNDIANEIGNVSKENNVNYNNSNDILNECIEKIKEIRKEIKGFCDSLMTKEEWDIDTLPCKSNVALEIASFLLEYHRNNIIDFLNLNGLNKQEPKLYVISEGLPAQWFDEKNDERKTMIGRKRRLFELNDFNNKRYIYRKDAFSLVNDENNHSGIVTNVYLPQGTVIAQYNTKLTCVKQKSLLNGENNDSFELMTDIKTLKETMSQYIEKLMKHENKFDNWVFGCNNGPNNDNNDNSKNENDYKNDNSKENSNDNDDNDESELEDDDILDIAIVISNQNDENENNGNNGNNDNNDTIANNENEMSFCWKLDENAKKRRKLNNGQSDNPWFDIKNGNEILNDLTKLCEKYNDCHLKLMLDLTENEMNNLMLFGMNINDTLCNCSYLWCNINGWPNLIIVTNRNIEKGSILIRKQECMPLTFEQKQNNKSKPKCSQSVTTKNNTHNNTHNNTRDNKNDKNNKNKSDNKGNHGNNETKAMTAKKRTFTQLNQIVSHDNKNENVLNNDTKTCFKNKNGNDTCIGHCNNDKNEKNENNGNNGKNEKDLMQQTDFGLLGNAAKRRRINFTKKG